MFASRGEGIQLRQGPYAGRLIQQYVVRFEGQNYAASHLVDPGNNASIMRLHPDAPATDPRSKMLLFSNIEDPDLRRNLSVKMSCDNGRPGPFVESWSQQRVAIRP